MKVQEMENLAIAFKFMLEDEGIPLVNIGMCYHSYCVLDIVTFSIVVLILNVPGTIFKNSCVKLKHNC